MGFKIHGSQNLCLFQRPGLHREAACFASRWKDTHHQLQPWLGFQGPSSGRPVNHMFALPSTGPRPSCLLSGAWLGWRQRNESDKTTSPRYRLRRGDRHGKYVITLTLTENSFSEYLLSVTSCTGKFILGIL